MKEPQRSFSIADVLVIFEAVLVMIQDIEFKTNWPLIETNLIQPITSSRYYSKPFAVIYNEVINNDPRRCRLHPP